MRYRIEFSAEDDVFTVVSEGRMTGSGFVALGKDLLNHPHWAKDKNVIFDHRALTLGPLPPEELDDIRAFHKTHEAQIGAGKSAIIVAPGMTDAWHHLWSQGDRIQTDNDVRVFESSEEAEHWALIPRSG